MQLKGLCEMSRTVTVLLNSQGKVASFTTVMRLAWTFSCFSWVTLCRARARLSECKWLPARRSVLERIGMKTHEETLCVGVGVGVGACVRACVRACVCV